MNFVQFKDLGNIQIPQCPGYFKLMGSWQENCSLHFSNSCFYFYIWIITVIFTCSFFCTASFLWEFISNVVYALGDVAAINFVFVCYWENHNWKFLARCIVDVPIKKAVVFYCSYSKRMTEKYIGDFPWILLK